MPFGMRVDDVCCAPKRETFLVPLRAFKGLCSTNLPPVISLETTIVGKRRERTVLINNTGTADSDVSLAAPPPFELQPRTFFLPVGGAQQASTGL